MITIVCRMETPRYARLILGIMPIALITLPPRRLTGWNRIPTRLYFQKILSRSLAINSPMIQPVVTINTRARPNAPATTQFRYTEEMEVNPSVASIRYPENASDQMVTGTISYTPNGILCNAQVSS